MDRIKVEETRTLVLDEASLWNTIYDDLADLLVKIYKEIGIDQSESVDYLDEDAWHEATNNISDIFQRSINYELAKTNTEVWWTC